MNRKTRDRRAQRRAKQSKRWSATKNARPGTDSRPGVEMGDQPEYSESRPREPGKATRD